MQTDERPPMAFNATDFDTSNYPLIKLSPLETELYKVIDDISTFDDAAKENLKLFRDMTMKRIHEFHEKKLVFSDGYDVWKSRYAV